MARRNPASASVGGHRLAGVVAAQVHVQLPVGEALGHLVCPLHGQRGLAHPGGAADRRNYDRRRFLIGVVQQPGQLLQLTAPAGEVPDPGRQLAWHGRSGAARHGPHWRWSVQHGVSGQHPLMQLPEPGSRLGPEFLDQHLPGVSVGGQGLPLPAVPV